MYGICEEALNSWTLVLMRSGCMGAAGTGVMMHMAGHTWCSAADAVHLRLRCGHVMVFNALFSFPELGASRTARASITAWQHRYRVLSALQGQLAIGAANSALCTEDNSM